MASPWLCDYEQSFCRRCGEPVVWMTTEKGKAIPLNLGWVRRIGEGDGLGLILYQPSREREGMAVVTAGGYTRAGGYSCHLATCPASDATRPEALRVARTMRVDS